MMDAAEDTNLTPKQRQWRNGHRAALLAIRRGALVQEAAAAAGVTRNTLWEWRRDDPEYHEAFMEAWVFARQSRLVDAENYLHRAVTREETDKPGVQAAERIVKSLARDVYGDKQTTDGNVNVTIQRVERVIVEPVDANSGGVPPAVGPGEV
jgi:hypothetical protein